MDASNVVEIPSFFQNKTSKKFTFTKEGIKIEKLMSFDPSVLLPSENICAFRYGVSLTRGYVFVIGRQYFIEIKDLQNKIFKIKLKSLYGIKRETYYKKWSDIFNQLWRNYFSDVLNYYTELYNIHQIFELAGVKFLSEGISWDNKNKLLWEEIALSNYRTYFMIHHIQNPNQNKSISFSTDWNAFILQSLLKRIISWHKPKN